MRIRFFTDTSGKEIAVNIDYIVLIEQWERRSNEWMTRITLATGTTVVIRQNYREVCNLLKEEQKSS